MAQRQLAQRTVTDIVLPDDSKAEMWGNVAKIAQGGLAIKEKVDVANMNDFAADANLQLMKTTNEWRVANESNPFDDKAIETLNSEYSKIFSQYDDKVGLMSRGQWQQVSQKMIKQQQADNLSWGTQRTVKNAENRVNSAIKKHTQMAQELGKTGDLKKAEETYLAASQGLKSFTTGLIGAETEATLMEDFRKDYMKSFLVGKAQTDPDGALAILESEGIAEKIGDADNVTLLKNLAIKQKKQNEWQVKEVQRVAVREMRSKVLNEEVDFNGIDEGIGTAYSAEDAFKLKKLLVQVDNSKSDPIKTAKYLDQLANLPIDSRAEAEKVYDKIMSDNTLSRKDKKTILFTDSFLDKAGDKGSIAKAASGDADVQKRNSWRNIWGIMKLNVNEKDAVQVLEAFQSSLDGSEDYNGMVRKAKKAVADVSVQGNKFLSDVGAEWVYAQDDNGSFFKIRKNEDGEFETLEESETQSDAGVLNAD